MNEKFIALAQSWEELNRAVNTLLVAQPANMTSAADAVDDARIKHERMFQEYSRSLLSSAHITPL